MQISLFLGRELNETKLLLSYLAIQQQKINDSYQFGLPFEDPYPQSKTASKICHQKFDFPSICCQSPSLQREITGPSISQNSIHIHCRKTIHIIDQNLIVNNYPEQRLKSLKFHSCYPLQKQSLLIKIIIIYPMDQYITFLKKPSILQLPYEEPLLILNDQYDVFLGPKAQSDIYALLLDDSLPEIKRGISTLDIDIDDCLEKGQDLGFISQKFDDKEESTPKNLQKRVRSYQLRTEPTKKKQKTLTSQIHCTCSKSKCQKNYCECYKAGQPCTKACICGDCKNTVSHSISSNKPKPKSICKCKKSHCSKKYCECHSSGNKCSPECQCLDCENLEENSTELTISNGKSEYNDFENKNEGNIMGFPTKKVKRNSDIFDDETRGNKENDLNLFVEIN